MNQQYQDYLMQRNEQRARLPARSGTLNGSVAPQAADRQAASGLGSVILRDDNGESKYTFHIHPRENRLTSKNNYAPTIDNERELGSELHRPSTKEHTETKGQNYESHPSLFQSRFNRNMLNPRFRSNRISTCKYTWWNFVPKNLFVQFQKMANLYFLMVLALQVIRPISISGGSPNILFPLVTVISLSAIKDYVEDRRRRF